MRRRRQSRQRHSSAALRRRAGELLLYGGNLDVDKRSALPTALGGCGNLVGSYDQTLAVVLTVYGNWTL